MLINGQLYAQNVPIIDQNANNLKYFGQNWLQSGILKLPKLYGHRKSGITV